MSKFNKWLIATIFFGIVEIFFIYINSPIGILLNGLVTWICFLMTYAWRDE